MGELETIEEVVGELALVSLALRARVAQLPDNPKINRINDRCFVISSKDLGPESILCPIYHDHKHQYGLVCDFIKKAIKSNPYKAVATITDMLKKERLRVSENYTQRLHPKVCEKVLKVLNPTRN
ncbi:MAG: hypothetical protein KAJ07_00355 [Planctomycetes bacterium]|nr:hypothetical protein [Planctomycetota bacterium]